MVLNEQWRKATKSSESPNCVEVRLQDDEVQVRDSKNPTGPVLIFNSGEWAAFLDGAEKGEFQLP